MPIFQINRNKASQVSMNINHFNNEAELRDFFDDNLEELLGMKFLAKEYPTTEGRMDTIAIDEKGSPVIIEYKWGQDDAIVVQGMFYFDWLKNNKKHFELLVADKLGKNIKVSWNKPRVLLVAQGFNNKTIIATRQTDYIELIRYVPYKDNILYLETIQGSLKDKSIKATKLKQKETIENEIKDTEYHLNKYKSTDEIKSIFYEFQKLVQSMPGVEELIDQKTGITYKTTKSFVRFEFGKTYINILVRSPEYDDPENLVTDISSHMWGYKGKMKIKSIKNIQDYFKIIKQSYEETL